MCPFLALLQIYRCGNNKGPESVPGIRPTMMLTWLHAFYGFDTQRIQTDFQRLRRQLPCASFRRLLRTASFSALRMRAVLVEAGEQPGDVIRIRAHDVRRTFTRDRHSGVSSNCSRRAASCASRSSLMITGALASACSSMSALRKSRQHTRMSILHIRAVLPSKANFIIIPVEDIVSGAVLTDRRISPRQYRRR